jgi:hypothetical protein
MSLKMLLFICMACSAANATGIQEVNYWRSKNGLKPFIEVPWMTDFCQKKAEYRAARGLKDNHAGPPCPVGCTEGCAESLPMFGWHTCCTEGPGRFAGAGVAIGEDGERYQVLLIWGKSRNRWKITPLKTAHLTPGAPLIKRVNSPVIQSVKSDRKYSGRKNVRRVRRFRRR